MEKYQIDVPIDKSDVESWVFSGEGYMEFPKQDASGIAVTTWSHLTVKMHRHVFYEFALVTQGCCVHSYRGVEVPLIPGDVFLIAPQEEHGYVTQSPMELINCQFYPEELSGEFNLTLERVSKNPQVIYDKHELKRRFNELLNNISEQNEFVAGYHKTQQTNLNIQGVIHLNTEERKEIEYLLQRMMSEQERKEPGFEFMKSACLQMILVVFQRIQIKRMQQVGQHQDTKKEYIYRTIDYMEENLREKLDLAALARRNYWSEGYFRSVFKDVTGLSPVEYINRLRIVKSLEYMEKEQLNIAEAAEKVGIYDPSYYSRIFKKIMGYSPRYFKSIQG